MPTLQLKGFHGLQPACCKAVSSYPTGRLRQISRTPSRSLFKSTVGQGGDSFPKYLRFVDMNRKPTDMTFTRFTANAGKMLATRIDDLNERQDEKTAINTEADR